MPEVMTAVIGFAALAAVIYAVGVDRTRNAAATGAGAAKTGGQYAKKAATSTTGLAVGGLGAGLQIGAEVVRAGMMEPFAVTTILAGVAGALGIEGMLGGITGLQYLLIGVALFAAVLIVGGDDD